MFGVKVDGWMPRHWAFDVALLLGIWKISQRPLTTLYCYIDSHRFISLKETGALNEELSETSYNELQIYQDWGSLLVIAQLFSIVN